MKWPINYALTASVLVQVLCQITKLIIYSIVDKKFRIKYLFTAGGMPSSHSAFVTSLTVSVGLYSGVSSEFFAIAFVFAAVIIYDAFRLRGTVQIHSRVIKKLLQDLGREHDEEIPEMVGHSIPEIIVGIIAGSAFAVLVYFLLGKLI
ncbi:MAG: divergent PAP2 family protein [Spirochaetales bacterium]|nr:divergent PAP2 family protein [Spirochaetales bacterium]